MSLLFSTIARATAMVLAPVVDPAPANETNPVATATPTGAQADDNVKSRLRALENKNAELENQIAALAGDVESFELRDIIPRVGDGRFGLAPGASKVYSVEEGISIGGYGEFLFSFPSGQTDVFDALRAITYIGYKFNENWVFNSEIEFEHGTTGTTSGTTDSGGSVSVEFAYIDYLHSDALNARGGLLLVPIGLINELHEPTTFLPTARPVTETVIIPTTWRENGGGIFGNVGGFDYRLYVTNGLEGADFSASGFRGGRQNGNRAAADDVALSARVDYVETPGLIVGGSIYQGESDQDQGGLPDLATTIIEAHADWKHAGWNLRILAAHSSLSNAGAFNNITGENVAEEMRGGYIEAGYDVMSLIDPESSSSLSPYIRWESIDTQAVLPTGFSEAGGIDSEIITYGINYKPIDQVVIKADYQDWNNGTDRFQIVLGYVF